MLLDLMAERAGVESPTLPMRIAAAALAAALTETSLYWAESGGEESLADLLDEALQVLQNGPAV